MPLEKDIIVESSEARKKSRIAISKKVAINLDERYFEKIVKQFQDDIFRVAFNYLKSSAAADDVVQDVLLKYYQSKKTFENEEHIKNWLIRVTINECKKTFRSPWAKHTVPIEDYIASLEFENPEESDLMTAVMALPKKYRLVVHLYYFEDYSVKEIADILNLSVTNVQTQLMRARVRLKKALNEIWEAEDTTFSTSSKTIPLYAAAHGLKRGKNNVE